jgi:hypothetical protein
VRSNRTKFEEASTGKLTVRNDLVIRATGLVSGEVRYGELPLEVGGEMAGDACVGFNADTNRWRRIGIERTVTIGRLPPLRAKATDSACSRSIEACKFRIAQIRSMLAHLRSGKTFDPRTVRSSHIPP